MREEQIKAALSQTIRRLDACEKRLNALDEKLTHIDRRVLGHAQRLEAVGERVDNHTKDLLETIEAAKQLGTSLGGQLDLVDARVKQIGEAVDDWEERAERLEAFTKVFYVDMIRRGLTLERQCAYGLQFIWIQGLTADWEPDK